ncbi:MAG: hypothetical protein IJR14_04485 [Synergistaceae bacterium]|nr:hypothetical protein [Synergistaceae bacterium]
MNINSYDTLGKSGMALMQSSMAIASKAATDLSSGEAGIMDIAQASMDMSQAKMQMAMGAYLIRTQEELMEATLQIFGVGTRHSGTY